MIRKTGDRVRLYTRRGYDWTERYPAVTAAAAVLKADSAMIERRCPDFRKRNPMVPPMPLRLPRYVRAACYALGQLRARGATRASVSRLMSRGLAVTRWQCPKHSEQMQHRDTRKGLAFR